MADITALSLCRFRHWPSPWWSFLRFVDTLRNFFWSVMSVLPGAEERATSGSEGYPMQDPECFRSASALPAPCNTLITLELKACFQRLPKFHLQSRPLAYDSRIRAVHWSS